MSLPSYQVDITKEHATTLFKAGEEIVVDHPCDADEEVLVALGYRQDLKRKFTVWSSFAVSFSVLGLLPSVAATLDFSLGYVGTGGMVWGWIVAGILIQTVALSMSELCSSMPTAVFLLRECLLIIYRAGCITRLQSLHRKDGVL
jgi:hypothetical protein